MSLHTIPLIGVELGSRTENTAISVTERAYARTGELFITTVPDPSGWERPVQREKLSVEYRIRLLERRPPPVLYKGVAERVAELVSKVGECVVAMDLTRTGSPVHTKIMEAILETGVGITHCPISVTGEHGAVSHSPDVGWLVPRRDLVSSALLLFEQGRLKIAEELKLAQTLTREFTDFTPKSPKEELEGWRLAKNDDLVLAVAMSVWAAERFLHKEDSVPAGWVGAA